MSSSSNKPNWPISLAMHPAIVAYIKSKPHALHLSVDPSGQDEDTIIRDQLKDARNFEPYPSPRSWTKLSHQLTMMESKGFSEDLILAMACALVGESRATDFMATRKVVTQLPDHNDLVMGRAEWPEDTIQSWACSIRAAQLITPGTFKKFTAVIKGVEPEFVQLFLAALEARLKGQGKQLLEISPSKGEDGKLRFVWDGVKDLLEDTRFGDSRRAL